MTEVKRILAVCMLVSHCGSVVHYASLLARQFRAELFVMNVVHNPFGIAGWNLPLPSLAEDYRKLLEKTRKDLHDIVSEEKQRGVAVRELVREGRPVDVILNVVRQEKIDLVVLPAHGETRLEHFLFGKDNESLLRTMPCSILFVKSEPEPVVEEEKQESEEE